MTWVKRLTIGLCLSYILLCAAVYAAQSKLLFSPPQSYLSPSDVGVAAMQEIEIVPQTTSWWAAPRNDEDDSGKDKKTVIIFHGNGSAVYGNYHIFADLIAQGHGLLSVGYPGYPAQNMPSQLSPSQAGMTEAAKANYQFVIEQNISPDNIVFYGTSLGSGVAAQLTASHPPSLLILDAPFNSVLDMGKKRMPFLPVSLLMKNKFQSDEALQGLDVPLIWTHGTKDRIIPLSQGQKLYDSYGGPKTAHIIEGGQHTNLWGLGAREIVLGALSLAAQIQP